MESGPALILRTLDRHLKGPGSVRLFGGAALILGYGRTRTTDDADLLLDDHECQLLIDQSGFAEAVQATNLELEPQGLYLTHIFGPEQQVLSSNWRNGCKPIGLSGLTKLQVSCLGALDLALTKMGRADDADLADIRFLLETGQLDAGSLRAAIPHAIVPPEYHQQFALACPKVRALLESEPD